MTLTATQATVHPQSLKLGGTALIVGAGLNFVRMIPLALSDGFAFDALPPQNLDEAVQAATLRGWHASHILALVSVPMLVFGLITAYRMMRTTAASSLALAGVVGMTFGLGSYAVAAVVDGLALPDAVNGYLDASGNEEAAAGVLAFHTHEFAGNFGGLGFAALTLSAGLLAFAVQRELGTRWYGWTGVAVSAIASSGYLTSLLAVDLGDGLVVILALVGITFLLIITLGVWMVRGIPSPAVTSN